MLTYFAKLINWHGNRDILGCLPTTEVQDPVHGTFSFSIFRHFLSLVLPPVKHGAGSQLLEKVPSYYVPDMQSCHLFKGVEFIIFFKCSGGCYKRGWEDLFGDFSFFAHISFSLKSAFP